MKNKKISVGIIGYGSLGKYLSEKILTDANFSDKYELAFVWNRSIEKLEADSHLLPKQYWLTGEFKTAFGEFLTTGKPIDIIVEVSHPIMIKNFGSMLLQHADLVIGSPTALAEQIVEDEIRFTANNNSGKNGVYVPVGAFWGAEDIVKMSELNTIARLSVSMTKPPHSFKLQPPLAEELAKYESSNCNEPFVIYEGSVRELCPLAPNNVNTMACAALAGSALGFDSTKAKLVADKRLEAHIVGIEVKDANGFVVKTERYNPCKENAVTGNATYGSFLSSIKRVGGKGNGFYFC